MKSGAGLQWRGRPAVWAAGGRGYNLDRVGDQPKTVAHVLIATTTAGPGSASKTRRTGSSRSPMPSGWISRLGTEVVRDGQTSSMCAPRMSS